MKAVIDVLSDKCEIQRVLGGEKVRESERSGLLGLASGLAVINHPLLPNDALICLYALR